VNKKVKRIAVISSFPPRKCGIATFTCDLISSIEAQGEGEIEIFGIAMRSDDETEFNDPVKFEIRRNVRSDYFNAAEYINCSHVDLVVLEHEFGLFGGNGGKLINVLLRKLSAPIVTTLHTVIEESGTAMGRVLTELCELSWKIVVMNMRGVSMLEDIYGVSSKKIELIPHGIPEMEYVESESFKFRLGLENRKTILTFGLLGRSKGIEVMLKALSKISSRYPEVLYLVVGATHPEVLKWEGEAYRFGLYRLARELGVAANVSFQNRFCSDSELEDFLYAADVYVTPYPNAKQLTSGTLARAMGAGKAIVSTPYWAAQELLAKGRGRITDFDNSDQIASAILELFSNEALYNNMRRRAYQYGLLMTWPKVGAAYLKLFAMRRPEVVAVSASAQEGMLVSELPAVSIAHMRRLTDDTGILQHTKYIIPQREFGYCTDDNARAMVVMCKFHNLFGGLEALDMLNRYISFCQGAQDNDGLVRNFMTYDRKWCDVVSHDALGRMLWGFGSIIASPPDEKYVPVVKEIFDKSVKHVASQSLRGKAYAIIGMAHYLAQFAGASEIKRTMNQACSELFTMYEEHSCEKWDWYEDALTYDNAIVPCAMLTAGKSLGEERFAKAGIKMCDFLISQTWNGNNFSFVGNNGWLLKNGKKASFDQQPLEAAASVLMLKSAYDVSSQACYLSLSRKAFDWFLGANDLGIAVYDFKTNGCCDALEQNGVNINQGAESTLSFLMALLATTESNGLKTDVAGVDIARPTYISTTSQVEVGIEK